ncbi:hypothetical protein [Tychonema sp. BBK16]
MRSIVKPQIYEEMKFGSPKGVNGIADREIPQTPCQRSSFTKAKM